MKASRERNVMRHATPEMRALIAQDRWGREYLAKLKPGKLPKREHGGYMRVAIYLADLGYRIMNDRHLAGTAQPDHAALAEALREYMDRHLSKFLRDADPMSEATPFQRFAFLDAGQADHLADSLTESLIRDWSPEWIEERQRRGGNGGRDGAPRRSTKATDENLARLAALPPGLTRYEQAEALGLSLATVKRLRARHELRATRET